MLPAGPTATGNAMGLGLASLTPEARKTFNLAESARPACLITKVDPNSDAADKGLQPGDVVQRVGGRPVHTPADVQSGVAEAKKGGRKSVLLLVASQPGRLAFCRRGYRRTELMRLRAAGQSLSARPPAPVAASSPTHAAGADPILAPRSLIACEFSSSRTIWKPSVIWFRG